MAGTDDALGGLPHSTPSDHGSPQATVIQAMSQQRCETHSLHFTLRQALKNTYSVWILSAFIAASAWRSVPILVSVAWILTVGCVFSLRVHRLQAGRDLAVLESNPVAWRRQLNGSTVVCGLVAALGPLVYFPSISDTGRMYISMIYCGWLAGAMSSLGARPRLYTGYGLIFVGGVSMAWFVVGSDYRYEVLAMLLLFLAITSGFARSFAAQVNESIEIRYANEQLLESLRTAHAAAEESSAAKSRFLAVASHDLRQPLHAVTLLNGLLARPQAPQRITEISLQMGRALATLERLFNSVLDFSRIDSRRVEPDLAWHDVGRIFAVMQTSYAAAAAAQGLEFRVGEANLAIKTDADLMERALRNLVENALKFTEQGSVELAAAWEDGDVVIAVSDTGPGIPAHLRDDIFKEYFQAVGGRRGAGLGLGLAIVQRLVDLLGLSVEVRDRLPHGSCFRVRIPADMARTAASLAEAEVTRREASLNGYFVVYVDDDAASRDAMALLLEDWGCRHTSASSLQHLLGQLSDADVPDAVLTDFSLNDGETGLDVINAMRQRYGAVSAAILTGDVSAIEMEDFGELEYPVLRKPVSAHELKELLEVFRSIG